MGRFLCLFLLLAVVLGCFAADAPVAEETIRKMKVKDLKRFLDDRGVDCDNCVEKADFVKKAVAAAAKPILDSKKPKKVNKDPIEKQWAPTVQEICKAETEKEDFCKQLKGVIDGSFFQYMRKYKRDLSCVEAEAATLSFKHPFAPIYKKIVKETIQFMLKENTKKQDAIRKKYEARFTPWMRDLCLENPNPMYEELGEMGANVKAGGGKRRKDEL